MTTAIKRRRGTTSQHSTFTGLEGEITVDTTKKTAVVHDGATAGGFPLSKEGHTHVATEISDSTAAGRTLLKAADVSAQRTALGLGTAALESSSAFAPAAHGHVIADVSGLQGSLDSKAPLASPAFSGTPSAPTATAGTNTTQLATTAFVSAALASLINSAPGALDTLKELADALGNDPNFASTVTTALATKLVKTANLSDLADIVASRTNLGLGSMAEQNASNVVITGGSISGITIDGGTF